MASGTILSHILSVLLLLIHALEADAAETVSIALPGCQDRCGNVSIPYPFGIGKRCSHSEWYEILCNGSIASLGKTHHEVVSISIYEGRGGLSSYFGHAVVVRGRGISSGCSSAGVSVEAPLDFSRSPFFISKQNTLTACGFNTVASLKTGDKLPTGCDLRASNETTNNRGTAASRRDYKCCRMDNIPYDLQNFSVVFLISDRDQSCQVAFLQASASAPADLSDGELLQISKDNFSVVLDWYVDENLGVSQDNNVKCTSGYEVGNYARCICRRGSSGNPYLRDGCKDTRAKRVWPIILGAVLGSGILILIPGIWRLYKATEKLKQMKLRRKFFKRNGGLLLQQQLSSIHGNIEKTRIFNSEELEDATDKFSESRILGQGGQGTVYKGILTDGRTVAVKKAKVIDEDKLEEFINEVIILSQMNHRNIVKLLGCCLETDVPILVYEFIPNGNLFEHLQEQSKNFPMTWEVRLRIATEIAGALYYLHSAASVPVYHRDIKSTNILLDEKYRSKLSDFGTSRSVTMEQTHLTTKVQGTAGYVDPEYYQSSHYTDKSDVYSFGVLLVELLTGQKPVSVMRPQDGKILATFFITSMVKGKLFDVLDTQVLEDYDPDQVVAVAELARKCLRLRGKKRPTMKEAAAELHRIQQFQKASEAQLREDEDVGGVETNMIQTHDCFCTVPIYDCGGTSSSVEVDSLVPHKTS